MRRFLVHLTTALGLIAFTNVALSDGTATLRQGEPISVEAEAPKMTKVENNDVKRVRNYPEQPPTIPHKTRSYEISLNANKCMSCHARTRTGESQAPMVSITHYMDRDNQVLATISPRRYFCNQCHVTQVEAAPLVENEFVDVEELLKGE
ncbi:nitrate reductase cytochrome c-type subunit [Kiloniella sp. EL199]|uniref:nitrate reductase cytochrome c-type subunit n=1 Tax=Kiloniella sp. EL199 TaxID=2107581 RepID=UPI000E9FFE6B|nr:nitrate reductase cytochrome c-type subunit [Kiloniella sp. EL199]